MGIYLPNMEMPTEGSWTTVRIYPDGTCAVPNWQGDCTLIKDTKAVPVPPHGDLIDRDALTFEDDYYGWRDKKVVKAAPTIIPAEEGFMKNGDAIRAMTDEELAETMLDCFAAFYEVEWSKKDILDWLKQEVKE